MNPAQQPSPICRMSLQQSGVGKVPELVKKSGTDFMQPAMPFRDPKQSDDDDDGNCGIASTTTSCSIATSSTTTRSCLDLILSLFFSTTLNQSIMQTFPFSSGVFWFMEMGLGTIL
ncbi:hypothetical protein AMTRI_Chr11g154000 [Amborella trichopoda]